MIGNGTYPDICIISNDSWGKQDHEVIKFLIEHFKTFLEKRGHNVRITSGSVDLDFVRMIRAKYLLPGCIMSSMSYMAGMLSDNISLLQSTIFSNNNFPKRDGFNIINSLNYRIPHNQIPDYYDFKLIDSKLSINTTKHIIAFQYMQNFEYMALENADLAKNIFPSWICHFYFRCNEVNKNSTEFKLLENMNNVELIEINENVDWRYIALQQNDYDVVLLRNVQSLLNECDSFGP